MKLTEIKEYLKSKKVLIIGSAGFIGRNLLEYFMVNNIDVHIVVGKSSNLWRLNEHKNVALHFANLNDYNETLELFKKTQANVIFHLASRGGHPVTITDFQNFMSENQKVTSNLLEASVTRGIDKFIFSGSSLEGEIIEDKVIENYSFKPHTFRGITKATESIMCNYYAEYNNLPLLNIRIFHAYGPWEQPFRFIPKIIMSFIKKQPITLIDPAYKKDYVFVDDVIKTLLLASYKNDIKSGSIINIGSGLLFSTHEIYTYLTEIFGYQIKIDTFPYPPKISDKELYVADLKNLKKYFDWQPDNTMFDGLVNTVEWFKNHSSLYDQYY